MTIQSPEARKAQRLFRKEEKVHESATAWAEYNGREAARLGQLRQLQEQRLARGPVALVVKPRAKPKSKRIKTPK